MEWSAIQTALVAVLASVSGVDATAIVWRPLTGSWMPDLHIRLSVLGGIRQVGRDERRTTYDAGTDTNVERIYGNRSVPISIRVESQDQDLASAAYATAEVIRAALQRSDVQETLQADASLGVSRMEPIRLEDYSDEDDRLRSVALLDVTFLAYVSQTGADVGYIQTINATGTYNDPAGNPADGSPEAITWTLP